MKVKSLIFAVAETIIKVVVLAFAIMYIFKGISAAYDFGYKVFADEPVSANNGRTITVGIPENADASDVSKMLEDKGIIKDARLFVVQEYLSEYHGKIKPGIYDLSTDMNAAKILETISAETIVEDEEMSGPISNVSEENTTTDDLEGDIESAEGEGEPTE